MPSLLLQHILALYVVLALRSPNALALPRSELRADASADNLFSAIQTIICRTRAPSFQSKSVKTLRASAHPGGINALTKALNSPNAVVEDLSDAEFRQVSSIIDRVSRIMPPGYNPSEIKIGRGKVYAFFRRARLLLVNPREIRAAQSMRNVIDRSPVAHEYGHASLFEALDHFVARELGISREQLINAKNAKEEYDIVRRTVNRARKDLEEYQNLLGRLTSNQGLDADEARNRTQYLSELPTLIANEKNAIFEGELALRKHEEPMEVLKQAVSHRGFDPSSLHSFMDYDELFADLVSVLDSNDPSVMARSLYSRFKIDTKRDFRLMRDNHEASQFGNDPHESLFAARSFIGRNLLERVSTLSLEEKRRVVELVAESIYAEKKYFSVSRPSQEGSVRNRSQRLISEIMRRLGR